MSPVAATMNSDNTREDMYTVPKLEPDGHNWIIFKNRIEWALAARGVVSHLDAKKAPKPAPPADPKQMDAYEAELAAWEKTEFTCRQQLARALPDSTLWKILHTTSVADMWTTIVTEFESKTVLVQADLRARFQSLKCAKKGDLRAHLDKLRSMREELAAVGVSLSDDEYTSTIIHSLPAHYANYIAHLSASAHLLQKTLKPDDTMRYLTQEYDRLNAGKAESSKGEKGVAFTALSSSSGNHGQRPRRKKGACWNCGGTGHKKDQCPSPNQDGKEKSSTSGKDSSKDSKSGKDHPSTSKGNSANVAEFEEDGAWAASAISSDEEFDDLSDGSYSLPTLKVCEPSDSEFWFSEAEDDDDTPHVANTSESGATLVTTVAPLASESVGEPGMAAAAGPGPRNPNRVVELYDSGTTHHLSPYRDRFVTFRPIPPKGFDAANQQSFSATGVGDMLVEVPNGEEVSTIRLTEVLYSPEVGYTLVSIG